MTKSEVRAFFTPYLRAEYPAPSASPTASCGRGAPESTLFVSLTGLRAWAKLHGLPEREAMARLLYFNIWPERFRRNFGLFSAQDMARLLRSRILVLGCGGLGGHAAELLARMGAGFLRLADNDVFDESNLNRQRFCTESALGRPKALVLRQALADVASHLDVEAVQLEADEHNLPDLLRGVDVALDCLDTIAAKTALERACLAAGVPFVHGSVLRDEGFAYVNGGPTPRLAELYPQGQSGDELAEARREGVGTLAPAAVACLMVRLCLRIVLAPPSESSGAGAETDGAGAEEVAGVEEADGTEAGGAPCPCARPQVQESASASQESAAGGASAGNPASGYQPAGNMPAGNLPAGHGPQVLSPLYHLDMSVPELERFFWE
ncbi:MAG: ThiF family adenylyltransferase [Desulfovibrio sp.]|uniref:HesA/MoeB/ThiF family protein n=1 Tax=Desulfovibrio sp. TaxID=885 RepID=UPI002A367E5D|nr:ThiF family adenylyltransferase [Desulfovibrio sp.]MDY0260682.1 ThiF family adenylyltransferase [Desulfovibrio sp.]